MTKFLSKKLVKALGIIAFAGLTSALDAQVLKWAPAGPIYNAGRSRNIVIDKADPSNNTMYVGSTSSGVFLSTDAGANWNPLNDQGTVRNISYMAQSANNTIYAGTGEGFLRPSQKTKALPGTGLYKLVGTVLTQVANEFTTGVVINKVACHPTLSNIIALATDKGILISSDGGSSFVNAVGTPTGQTGLDIKFDNTGVLWASVGSELGNVPFNAISSTVWKSAGNVNGTGVSFTDKTPSSNIVNGTNYGRIELAISPQNANVVYASCAAKYQSAASATLQGLFVTYDGGTTWGTVLVGSSQLDPLFNGTTRASGDYAHSMLVDPSNSNKLYLCGYRIYTFTRTGGTDANPIGNWVKPGFFFSQQYYHENIHDIKMVTVGGSLKWYFTTDAGIYRSGDFGNIDVFFGDVSTFQPFYKGLITGQFNSVDIERTPIGKNTGSTTFGDTIVPYSGFLGGTGGNGANYFSGKFPNVTQEISSLSGDVFNVQFSKLLPKAALITTGTGELYRNSNVKTADPALVNIIRDTKSQTVVGFDPNTYNISGRPFKLWENYGQLYKGSPIKSPDSLVFYNDTTVALSAIASLSATSNFTFTVGRPQPSAIIDYVTVKMVTVTVLATLPTPDHINLPGTPTINTQTVSIMCDPNYSLPLTGTISVPNLTTTGFAGASQSIIINSSTNLDEVRISLSAPFFTAEPTTVPSVTNQETYVRLRATVYYRYNNAAPVTIIDDAISTFATTYSLNTMQALKWTLPATSTLNATSNKIQKYPPYRSARLAVAYLNNRTNPGGQGGGVYVCKAPLDLNSPISLVKVSANKALTTNSLGVATNNTVSVLGTPSLLEWSKSGTELYYTTDSNEVFRVSNLYTILDSSSKSYSGKLHTNIFTYSNTPVPPSTVVAFYTPNPRSPYRTTFLGKFTKPITSISIGSNDSVMVLTFNDPTGVLAMSNGVDIRKCDNTNVGFTNKTGTGTFSNVITYCSLMEKSDYRKVFVGTDKGIYWTQDITQTSPVWTNVNVGTPAAQQLPNGQVFDIRQQTMNPWECFNSGQIYVATNGRGIWTNNNYYNVSVVSVREIVASAHANNLGIYPNPTNGEVFVTFNGYQGESAVITVMDINGRIVKSDALGKLNAGETTYSFETGNLTNGVYIVNVTSDSGLRRVSKLIVSK